MRAPAAHRQISHVRHVLEAAVGQVKLQQGTKPLKQPLRQRLQGTKVCRAGKMEFLSLRCDWKKCSGRVASSCSCWAQNSSRDVMPHSNSFGRLRNLFCWMFTMATLPAPEKLNAWGSKQSRSQFSMFLGAMQWDIQGEGGGLRHQAAIEESSSSHWSAGGAGGRRTSTHMPTRGTSTGTSARTLHLATCIGRTSDRDSCRLGPPRPLRRCSGTRWLRRGPQRAPAPARVRTCAPTPHAGTRARQHGGATTATRRRRPNHLARLSGLSTLVRGNLHPQMCRCVAVCAGAHSAKPQPQPRSRDADAFHP